ncbi:MAG: hypothetical protein RSF90_02275 [Pygmaiobacter sp.]
MSFMPIILMAVIVEGLITYLQLLIRDRKMCWQMALSIAIGVFCSVVYQIDLFALLGLSTGIPYVGSVLTGVLVSRGSNYLFDLIKQLGGLVNELPKKTDENFIGEPRSNTNVHEKQIAFRGRLCLIVRRWFYRAI